MKKLKAYKIRIYPNETQKVQLAKTFGSCRFLYNQMLSERKQVYEQFKDDKKDFIHMLTRQKNNINLSLSFLKKLNQRACNSQELT